MLGLRTQPRIIATDRKLIILAVLVFLGSTDTEAQSILASQNLPKFMGREVTIIEPELDADGFFPTGPASVCVEGPPQRQCYTAPKGFGRSPTVAAVEVVKDLSALFFSAKSGGVSGWEFHFALLRPGEGKNLENLFASDTTVSNQSEHAFWQDAAISEASIFVTADYVLGPDESHYSEHRYIISAYAWRFSSLTVDFSYYLEDRYMTAHKYDWERDILNSERQEILARLKRLKAETKLQQRAPR
jgi:hypothetical protein